MLLSIGREFALQRLQPSFDIWGDVRAARLSVTDGVTTAAVRRQFSASVTWPSSSERHGGFQCNILPDSGVYIPNHSSSRGLFAAARQPNPQLASHQSQLAGLGPGSR